jgi:uncharacterized protein with ParB-like and HNH nuclease domain
MAQDEFGVGFCELLDKRFHVFVIPQYQRAYRWSDVRVRNWLAALWEQSATAGLDKPHYFMGAIILTPSTFAGGAGVKCYDVVDGQQRITSFSLLVAAVFYVATELSSAALERVQEVLPYRLLADNNKDTRIAHWRLKNVNETRHVRQLRAQATHAA